MSKLKLRDNLIDLQQKKVLIANLNNSLESNDAYTRLNCQGFGRIRVYKNYTIHMSLDKKQTRKPLYRGHPPTDVIRTQVFQLAGCNWRCWYCFVDYHLLSGLKKYGRFFSCEELIDLYLQEKSPPKVIDLTGGQPDLVPEWCLWIMEEIQRRGLTNQIYIWQDDNLSTDLLWEVLSTEQIQYMAQYPKHSRACCFKGYDETSFAFNTGAKPEQYDRQFEIFARLLKSGFDLYAYVTFTAPQQNCTREKIARFVDRLQAIHSHLPLRTIPLEIKPFTATSSRMHQVHKKAMEEQFIAYQYWWEELSKRFSSQELSTPYDQIPLKL